MPSQNLAPHSPLPTPHNPVRLAPLCGLLLLTALGVVRAGYAQAQSATVIQTQPLREALLDLARAHDLDLIYDPTLIAEHTTTYVWRADRAQRDPERHLARLLDGSGLAARRLGSGVVAIVPLLARATAPPTGRIAGRVLDAETGLPLPGAHILLADGSGVATSSDGTFALPAMPPGAVVLRATFVGYDVDVDTALVESARLAQVNMALHPAPVSIRPLIVEGSQARLAEQAERAAWRIGQREARSMGTPDALGSLGTILGVRIGDGLADVHLQGGDAGAHQFRLDGVPIFEPVHLPGLVGAFNPFALERIVVHKAGYGAGVGSHLAGVVDAQQMLGSPSGEPFDVQADPLSLNARLHLARKIGSGRLRVMAAGRTSLWRLYQPAHTEQLLRDWYAPDPFLPNATLLAAVQRGVPVTAEGSSDSLTLAGPQQPAIGFTDLHFVTEWERAPGHTLRLTAYHGQNSLNANRPSASTLDLVSDGLDGGLPLSRDDYTWANTLAQVRYRAMLRPAVLFESHARASRYHLSHQYNALAGDAVRLYFTPEADFAAVRVIEGVAPTDDGNRVTEVAAGLSLDFTGGRERRPVFASLGGEVIRTIHRFSMEDVYFRPISVEGGAGRAVAFGEVTWLASRAWQVTLGTRATLLPARRAVYAEPRASLRGEGRAGLLGMASLDLAAGLFRQYLNPFDVSSVSPSALLPAVRFWVPLDETVAPPKAWHLGVTASARPEVFGLAGLHLHAEAYAKRQTHLLLMDYPALWQRMENDADLASEEQAAFLRGGRGYAWGAGLRAEHLGQHHRLALRYEYSVAKRTSVLPDADDADDAEASPTAGSDAPPSADIATGSQRLRTTPWNEPHRAEAGLDWMPMRTFTATLRARGGWGRAWGFRRAYYDYLGTDPLTPPVYGGYDLTRPEEHRLPAFVQVDIGAARTWAFRGASLQVRGDLLNVLGRANVADWRLGVPTTEGGSLTDPTAPEPQRITRYLPSRTPSLAVRVQW